nr:hypothetical protein [Tanacetum cinerariifolium]
GSQLQLVAAVDGELRALDDALVVGHGLVGGAVGAVERRVVGVDTTQAVHAASDVEHARNARRAVRRQQRSGARQARLAFWARTGSAAPTRQSHR